MPHRRGCAAEQGEQARDALRHLLHLQDAPHGHRRRCGLWAEWNMGSGSYRCLLLVPCVVAACASALRWGAFVGNVCLSVPRSCGALFAQPNLESKHTATVQLEAMAACSIPEKAEQQELWQWLACGRQCRRPGSRGSAAAIAGAMRQLGRSLRQTQRLLCRLLLSHTRASHALPTPPYLTSQLALPMLQWAACPPTPAIQSAS